MAIDLAGVVKDKHTRYYAFGDNAGQSVSTGQDYKYTGQPFDDLDQSIGNAFMHATRAPYQSVDETRQLMEKFLIQPFYVGTRGIPIKGFLSKYWPQLSREIDARFGPLFRYYPSI